MWVARLIIISIRRKSDGGIVRFDIRGRLEGFVARFLIPFIDECSRNCVGRVDG